MHLKIQMKNEPDTFCEVETKNLQVAVEAVKHLIQDKECSITVLQFPPKGEFEVTFK